MTYPFSAVVGLADLKLALVLNAVSPRVGGVLVRGEKGTAKSTIVRALAALLPPVEVADGCRFSCDPSAPDPACPDAPHPGSGSVRPARLVELPVGASEDRLAGSLDLERALTEGVRAFEPGLLAAAHRGVLYVDEVNLLHDHLVDLLLDAAALGTCYVEREGVSVRHAARFLLAGTMNPEEGELRPQLLDRFGLTVEARASRDPAERAEVIRRRLAYELDPAGFAARWSAAESDLAHRIASARALLPGVVLSDSAVKQIATVCAGFEVDGMRADLVTAHAALAHAAWHGRSRVTSTDVRQAARLALPHRRRRDPFDAPGLDEAKLDELLSGFGDYDPDDDPPDPGGGHPPDFSAEGSGGSPDPVDEAGSDSGPLGQASDDGVGDPSGHRGASTDVDLLDRSPEHDPSFGADPNRGGSTHEPDGEALPPAPGRDGNVTLPPSGRDGYVTLPPSGQDGEAPLPSSGQTTPASDPPYRARLFTLPGIGSGAPGRRSRARTPHGRTVGARLPSGGRVTAIHLMATLWAAAPHQRQREAFSAGGADPAAEGAGSATGGADFGVGGAGSFARGVGGAGSLVGGVGSEVEGAGSLVGGVGSGVGGTGSFARGVGSEVEGADSLVGGVGSGVGGAGSAVGRGGIRIERSDLREAVREGREGNLVLFAVDASGSMAARRRMGAVKAAVLSLLLDAYQRRDKVGLITFRGETAELVLPPTSSVEAGAARMRDLRTGGRTPLAAGLLKAADVLRVEQLRDLARRPLLVLVTDGRATSGTLGEIPLAAARLAGTATVLVDCETGPIRLGLAGALAAHLNAALVHLDELAHVGLAHVVRASRSAA